MTWYKVTNNGIAPKIVYDVHRKMKQIAPNGGSETIRLNDRAAASLRNAPRVHIVEVADENPDRVVKNNARDDDFNETTGNDTGREDNDPNTQPSRPATELLEKMNSDDPLEYHDFVAQAKVVLGDEYPSGTPKKRVVLELLEEYVEKNEQ